MAPLTSTGLGTPVRRRRDRPQERETAHARYNAGRTVGSAVGYIRFLQGPIRCARRSSLRLAPRTRMGAIGSENRRDTPIRAFRAVTAVPSRGAGDCQSARPKSASRGPNGLPMEGLNPKSATSIDPRPPPPCRRRVARPGKPISAPYRRHKSLNLQTFVANRTSGSNDDRISG